VTHIIYNRLIFKGEKLNSSGMTVLNYPEKFDEALKKIGEWLFTGKIKVRSLLTH
jgi:NADPH-dependent curcumin reductase CurA